MNYYRLPRSTSKCGKSAMGQPCSTGPIHGRCGLQGSGSAQVPCKPIRTLHWWNNTIRIAFALLCLILVSFAWGNISTRRIVTPGSLSVSHAQLLVAKSGNAGPKLAIDANNRCSACHPGLDARDSNESAIHLAAQDPSRNTSTNSQPFKITQSLLCLNCHKETMPDAQFGSPHDLTGVALEQLVQRENRKEGKSLFARLVGHRPIVWESSSTECGQCHREHQGASHDLQIMTSERCQACHQEAFKSFSNGHPEFQNYPAGADRRIAFDHKRHQDLHYTKKSADFDCKSCHVQSDQVGAVGQVFRSLPFETACASCHAEPTKSAVQDGLIVIQLPSVNRKRLSEAGLDIGEWPEQASQINDGTIPLPMRWLLQAEVGGDLLLNSLPPSGRLSEVDMADPSQRQALANLIGATKNLMSKLANQGQPGFRESIEKLVAIPSASTANSVASSINSSLPGKSNQQQWLDQFASGIPPDMFRAAMSEWFVPSLRAQSVTTTPWPNHGLGSTNSDLPSKAASETAKVWLSSQIQSSDDDLLVAPSKTSGASGEDLLQGDSLLDGNLLDGNAQNGALPNSDISSNAGTSSNPAFRDTKAWDQLSYGGWMIDRQRMAVVYVPKGHADPWLSRWIELEKIKNPNVDSVTASGFMGQQCKSCHLLGDFLQASNKPAVHAESKNSGKNWQVSFRQVNASQPVGEQLRSENVKALFDSFQGSQCWRGERRAANASPITKFDHTPHLSLPSINDCRSCHLLTGSDRIGGTDNNKQHTHEFTPMQKAQCSSCHTANAAGESCTQCHNYHVGNAHWR